ncbi:MAG: tannase/feruloyl esterase family alpha/beta hydrolase [Gammaproteobacteria bacterium]|nr:MAG: tannase/feruloyl esterase family alpha/beta hydrolase [Gammaproteobacteria bacterium]
MFTNILSLRIKSFPLSGICLLLAFYNSPAFAESGKTRTSCVEIANHNFPAALQLELRESKINEADAFCQVKGIVNSRIGIDGKHYGIEFEMRLPLSWNERFLYQMNGGNDGTVVAAEGDASNLNAFAGRSARARGYAVLSTNAGHAGDAAENQQYGLTASNRFGLDPQAREDYGYAATATMTPVANAIINQFYGKPSAFSYLAGCSNGGRHGMVAASRYGDMFDGILVGAPGFNLPKAAVQHAWDVQRTQQVDPKLHNAFSRADMKLIGDKVLEACDQLDNVKDGLVNNIQRCQREFNINNLRCKNGKSSACLSHLQIHAFSQIMSGPRNSRGENLYSSWWYDAGVADEGWRFWKFESPIPTWNNNPLIATMGAGSLAYLFTTPPTEVGGTPEELLEFLSKFDFDHDAPKIFATNNTFKKSAMEIMTPPDIANPRLTAFNKHGGKLIIYQGQSDPVFSTVDIVKWYERLNKNYHGKAQDFARLFVVPGMNHCSGGPATDQFDGLAALEKWVEQGVAPDNIAASVSAGNQGLPQNWSPTRTRPLCPWPRFASYQKGDIESATSFVCL